MTGKLSQLNSQRKHIKGYRELQSDSHAYCTHKECAEEREGIKQSWRACRYYVRGYQNGTSTGYRNGYKDGLFNGAIVKKQVKKHGGNRIGAMADSENISK